MNIRKINLTLLCITCLIGVAIIFSVNVKASTTVSTIEKILLYEAGDLVYIYPAGGINSPTACHAGSQYYTYSMSRPRGKEYLAGLYMAHATGKTVTLWGKNLCQDQSTKETLDYFDIGQ